MLHLQCHRQLIQLMMGCSFISQDQGVILMPPQMIPAPLVKILELFQWLMVVLLMDTFMMGMGTVSVNSYSNYLEGLFVRMTIFYSLYSNSLNHLQQSAQKLLSLLLFYLLQEAISDPIYFVISSYMRPSTSMDQGWYLTLGPVQRVREGMRLWRHLLGGSIY